LDFTKDGGLGQGRPLCNYMVEIHLYCGGIADPVKVVCSYCKREVGSKACLVIIFSEANRCWLCVDCVKILDFSCGEFLCGG